jgi:Putative beta-barrel porin 2
MAWAIEQLKKFTASFLCASIALALFVAGSTSDSIADELPNYTAGAPTPLLVGGWQLSPTLFAGAVYNTNVNQTSTNAAASWGERVTPGITANLDNGIYKTRLYGVADLQNYSNSSANNTVYANAGFTQEYLPTPDLTFRLTGNYTRSLDVFGSSALAPANTAPIATTTVSPQANANPYNQFLGAVSGEKSFGRTFVGLTATIANTQSSGNSASTTNSNGTTYTITQRTGFNLTPQLYAFVDPSVNWQRYADSTQNQNGYRVTAGVGTLAVGIWRGELYGGYQAEKSDISGTYDSPVFGGRIVYSPTPIWEFNASLDENFGAATFPTTGTTGTTGTGSQATTALLNVGYKGLPPAWTTSARFGSVRTRYIDSPRIDNGWLAGATITYEFWRNLGITLDYQFKSVVSNVALQSFDQQMVTLGASYKY